MVNGFMAVMIMIGCLTVGIGITYFLVWYFSCISKIDHIETMMTVLLNKLNGTEEHKDEKPE